LQSDLRRVRQQLAKEPGARIGPVTACDGRSNSIRREVEIGSSSSNIDVGNQGLDLRFPTAGGHPEAISHCDDAAANRRTGINSALLGHDMAFLAELWEFMRVSKKFWLLPLFLLMLACGGLIVLTKGSAIAPFIYTVF
jgi:hypothetical protein